MEGWHEIHLCCPKSGKAAHDLDVSNLANEITSWATPQIIDSIPKNSQNRMEPDEARHCLD
jgi:hypothetical protein